MYEYHLLEIMAIGFALALAFGFITHRLGLSSIVGYLFAGFLIGPFSPGFVADYNIAHQLSEAGVILLMFGVGLHFKLDDLMAVKGIAVPGAIAQSTAATICGIIAGMSLGLDLKSSIILGIGLSVAGTAVLLKVLNDNNSANTVHGHAAVGWLVVEDIFTVMVLVVLPLFPALFDAGGASAPDTFTIIKAVFLALLRIAILWALVMGVGGKLVPLILAKVAKTRSQELFTLTVLVIAFATAVTAALIFQASFALGAFLGGMVVGKSKVSHQAAADLLPLRDSFTVLFFLSVGMLFAPKYLLEYPLLIAACLIIVLVIKPLSAMIIVAVLGYSPRTALTVAAGLSQVGEFSFILAQEAKRLNLVNDAVYNVIIVCAIISISLNPSLFKRVPKYEKFLKTKKKIWRAMTSAAKKRGRACNKNQDLTNNLLPAKERLKEKTAIVVGYGPAGKDIVRALIEHNVTPVVIEMNIDTVNALSGQGEFAIYGDSTKKSILTAAGIESADYLIITVPSLTVTSDTAVLAASMNPNTRILARARFLQSKEYLKQIGVTAIAFEEEEVSKSLVSLLLDDLENQRMLAAAAEIVKDNN
ncbi:MAG: cation:proton antiporter [Endomicrobia bacterium]|nr:cation:proton antiporter [Endomicrobiia bacterium]